MNVIRFLIYSKCWAGMTWNDLSSLWCCFGARRQFEYARAAHIVAMSIIVLESINWEA